MDDKRLYLLMLSEPRGWGYYYLVQKGFAAYTAFRTYKALRTWMDDRGLTAKFSHRYGHGHALMTLHGDFREIMATDQAAWDAIIPVRTVPFLSNGSYTLAKIHYDGNLRLLTYLNPNVRTRPTLDHAATEQALDSGADLFAAGVLPMTDNSARDVLLRMVANFPGLYDGETEVGGADLVEWMTNEIEALKPDGEMHARAVNGSPTGDGKKE